MAALDNIFDALKGFRIFDRFGFDTAGRNLDGKTTVVNDCLEWHFEAKAFDWYSRGIDLPLSGYMPTEELVNLLAYNIDTYLE